MDVLAGESGLVTDPSSLIKRFATLPADQIVFTQRMGSEPAPGGSAYELTKPLEQMTVEDRAAVSRFQALIKKQVESYNAFADRKNAADQGQETGRG